MPRTEAREITIAGKKYIDLTSLEEAIKSIYPLKTHSLRRLARYGRIPYKKVGIGLRPKFWFNLDAVKKALNLVLEDDPQLVDTENYMNVVSDISLASEMYGQSDILEAWEEDYLGDL
jgi:hypothetical protein